MSFIPEAVVERIKYMEVVRDENGGVIGIRDKRDNGFKKDDGKGGQGEEGQKEHK